MRVQKKIKSIILTSTKHLESFFFPKIIRIFGLKGDLRLKDLFPP